MTFILFAIAKPLQIFSHNKTRSSVPLQTLHGCGEIMIFQNPMLLSFFLDVLYFLYNTLFIGLNRNILIPGKKSVAVVEEITRQF